MKAFVFGAGAQGRVTVDIIRSMDKYDSIGLIDEAEELWGKEINGITVTGGLDYVFEQDPTTFEMVVALGKPELRIQIAEKLKARSILLMNAIHSPAVVAPSATVGVGSMVSAGAAINTNAVLGDYLIVNTGAVVEHDSVLADGVSISPGVQLGGRVTVGRGSFVGTGAIVIARVSIGENSIVGAGSIVNKNVPDNVMVVGTPAREIKKIDESFDWKKLF